MRSLLVIIVLMLTAHVFAQEPAQDLQDSLEYDRLDPSIKEEFEELKKWSAIKDKCILQEYCYNCNVYDVKPYTPYGFRIYGRGCLRRTISIEHTSFGVQEFLYKA